MARTKASRKYQLTFNNPLTHGFDHQTIKNNISGMSGVDYWCMCDEIGLEGETPHTHVYIAFQHAKEFSSIQRRFYGAHIECCNGSHQQNRDYLTKEGKWLHDPKRGTIVEGTFEESGALPEETDARIKQSEAVLAMIEDGASNAEILHAFPSQINHLPRLDQARQTLLEERYRKEFRTLHVTYLYGKPGVGKTRSIMEEHGYENVYRVTDYTHPFDSYAGEDVLLLDEFRSSLPFVLLLNVLDGYPLMLPCRYANRAACFTKVYLVSNIPLDKQYPNIQLDEPASFQALLRRIDSVAKLLGPAAPDEPF